MDTFLYSKVNGRDLGILRITVFGIWFIILLCTSLTNYAYLPHQIFTPRGIFRLILTISDPFLLNSILSYSFLLALKITLLVGCFLCMLGIRPFKMVAIPTILLLFLYESVMKGFGGYVNHADLGLLYGALILCLFPSRHRFSVFPKSTKQTGVKNYALPILFLAIILCVTYSFVGLNRVFKGGVNIFLNDTLLIHLINHSLEFTKYGFYFGLFVARSKLLLFIFKMGFIAVTLCEVLAPLVLLYTPFRYVWLAVILPFHLLSLFTMNILFWQNLILLILLFYLIPQGYFHKKSNSSQKVRKHKNPFP